MKKAIKNKGVKFGRKGIGVEELIGLNEKRIDEISIKNPSIKKTIKKDFGRVRRYKREILRQRKSVSHHTELLNKYLKKMEAVEVRYKSMISLLEPKVTLKRPTKSYPFWRGKVWWGVGRFKQRGWEEFHIISEKKRDRLGLNEDEVREMGVVKFRDKLIRNDLILD